jgi:hypothetical protein
MPRAIVFTLSINESIYPNGAEVSAVKALLVFVQGVDIRGDFAAELAGDGLAGKVLGLSVLLVGENVRRSGKRDKSSDNDRDTLVNMFLSF